MEEYYRNNREYLSVVFIMAGDEELRRKVSPYLDTKEGMFSQWKCLKNKILAAV
jgi:hypothetical protein